MPDLAEYADRSRPAAESLRACQGCKKEVRSRRRDKASSRMLCPACYGGRTKQDDELLRDIIKRRQRSK
jgi:hypothetical protein